MNLRMQNLFWKCFWRRFEKIPYQDAIMVIISEEYGDNYEM